MELNQIFVLRDYDTYGVTSIYLTNDALGCCKAFKDVEKLSADSEDNESPWDIFLALLEQRDIIIKAPEDTEEYYY